MEEKTTHTQKKQNKKKTTNKIRKQVCGISLCYYVSVNSLENNKSHNEDEVKVPSMNVLINLGRDAKSFRC